MNNSDMPVNPVRGANNVPFSNHDYGAVMNSMIGLTKREYFAGLAMQNILSKYDPYEYGDFDSSDFEVTAKNAVGLADALLKELSK